MAAVFSTVFKVKGHHMKSPPPPEVKKVHGGEPKQLRFSQFPTCVAAGQEMFFFFPETVPAAIFWTPKMLFWYRMALVK